MSIYDYINKYRKGIDKIRREFNVLFNENILGLILEQEDAEQTMKTLSTLSMPDILQVISKLQNDIERIRDGLNSSAVVSQLQSTGSDNDSMEYELPEMLTEIEGEEKCASEMSAF